MSCTLPPASVTPKCSLELRPDAPLRPDVWRAHELPAPCAAVWPSGFSALDAVLPGGGWPGQCLTELLHAQSGTWEWRLLAPVLSPWLRQGRSVVVLGPPQPPHLPGCGSSAAGGAEPPWLWVQARTAAERLWSAEQLLKADATAAVLLWLPQARSEQIRRLQVAAQSHQGPVFVFRPQAVAREASAAPLRLRVDLVPVAGATWPLRIQVLKRRGLPQDGELVVHAPPVGLSRVLPPRWADAAGWSLAAVPTREPSSRRMPAATGGPRTWPPVTAVARPATTAPAQFSLFDDALGRVARA